MSLIKEAIEKSISIWNKCINHPFIVELCNGTLVDEKMKKYIFEDSIYLREYTKAFCYAIINCDSLSDIKMFYSMMSYVNEEEGSTRLKYLKRFNLNDEMLNKNCGDIECKDYYEFMINESKKGKLECLMSTLPCMLSYRYIFENSKINKNNKFIEMINDYLSPRYLDVCEKWSEYTDFLAKNIDEKRKEELIDIFVKSSIYELEFWNMSYYKI